jgi:Fe-S cluster assembly scaffold protein SufB
MTAPASRPRPARRALDELSLPVDPSLVDALATASPDWLATDRRAAAERWASLPAESNLLYTPYIDLRSARLEGARVTTDVAAAPVPVPLPDGADGLLEIGEGDVTAAALSPAAAEAGVVLTAFGDLVARDPDRARSLLESAGAALPATDKFAQLTRALWSQGIVLDVPDGVRLERPIIVRWAAGAPDRALLTRTLVRVGDASALTLVEELVSSEPAAGSPGGQSYLAGTLEFAIGRDARVAVASLQELGPETVAFQHRHAEVGEGSTLHWALGQLGGRLVRSRVDNRLVGDRSSVEQVEIVFGGDEQSFDLTSYTTHIGRDTTGNLLSKGALLEGSRAYFKGLIDIQRTAIGTDSFLGEFGMNLSKRARSVAIPSLEIDQPDCRRAAHSSSVGPIDEAQLFYLESRGIPPDEARKFIVLGFLEPVVARVPLAAAQDRLRELLEAKWAAGVGGGAEAAA